MASKTDIPIDEGKNWLKGIKKEVMTEGFPNPSKNMSKGLTLSERPSSDLTEEFDYFVGWRIRGSVRTVEYYIISKTTGNKSRDYCAYKFYDMLTDCYDQRAKKISREFSRRQHEFEREKI